MNFYIECCECDASAELDGSGDVTRFADAHDYSIRLYGEYPEYGIAAPAPKDVR